MGHFVGFVVLWLISQLHHSSNAQTFLDASNFIFGVRIWEILVLQLQSSPFITLCLGSIELDHVISEPCYKGIIL